MNYTCIKWAILVVVALYQMSSIALDVLVVCYGTMWIGLLFLSADTLFTLLLVPVVFCSLFKGEPTDASERKWNETLGVVLTVLLVIALCWSCVMLGFIPVAYHTSVGDWSLIVRGVVGSVPVCLLMIAFIGVLLVGCVWTLISGLVQIIKDADVAWLSFIKGACVRACCNEEPEETV